MEKKEITLDDYLEGKCFYANKSNMEIQLDYVNDLIEKEKIELEYTFEECAMAYATYNNMDLEQAKICCLRFLVEVGLTRHIIDNLRNFKYYGYSKELEEIKNSKSR